MFGLPQNLQLSGPSSGIGQNTASVSLGDFNVGGGGGISTKQIIIGLIVIAAIYIAKQPRRKKRGK